MDDLLMSLNSVFDDVYHVEAMIKTDWRVAAAHTMYRTFSYRLPVKFVALIYSPT